MCGLDLSHRFAAVLTYLCNRALVGAVCLLLPLARRDVIGVIDITVSVELAGSTVDLVIDLLTASPDKRAIHGHIGATSAVLSAAVAEEA